MKIQLPVVAGKFYPADPTQLQDAVDALLSSPAGHDVPQPKALILPHAGYRFSGSVAAVGVAHLREGIRRVVILGPSHHHAFAGVGVPDADAMATPLGDVPVDRDAVATILNDPDVSCVPDAFTREHAIEVELPLLQRRLGAFQVVPLVVGDIAPARLAKILDHLWGGPETLIVISTDLTHFLNSRSAEKADLATAHAIEMTDTSGLTAQAACGHRPLSAFLHCARRRGMRLTRLALTHSGKGTTDQSRVVGYGAWMAHGMEEACLPQTQRQTLLRVARQAIRTQAQKGRAPKVALESFAAPLRSIAASFVTLTRHRRLRGCIGSLQPHQSLAEDVVTNASKAAFHDPRFDPVRTEDVETLHIEIAVLSRPSEMRFQDQLDLLQQLRPGRDGLILSEGQHRSTFLPKVWESLPEPQMFLRALKIKANLAPDHWSPTLSVSRYIAETFHSAPEA